MKRHASPIASRPRLTRQLLTDLFWGFLALAGFFFFLLFLWTGTPQ